MGDQFGVHFLLLGFKNSLVLHTSTLLGKCLCNYLLPLWVSSSPLHFYRVHILKATSNLTFCSFTDLKSHHCIQGYINCFLSFLLERDHIVSAFYTQVYKLFRVIFHAKCKVFSTFFLPYFKIIICLHKIPFLPLLKAMGMSIYLRIILFY